MDASPSRSQIMEPLASLAVLFVMLIYTYGVLLAAPYSGFHLNLTTNRVEKVYLQSGDIPLQDGDVITHFDGVSMRKINKDRRLAFLSGFQMGDPIKLRVDRNGQPVEIQWTFPGFNRPEFFSRLFNSWLVGYAFWLAGFATQLSIRPRDARRRLFITANYLTALFLVSGNLSSWRLWESSTLLHMSAWLMAPVFLQLHWEFPRPLRKTSRAFWSLLYAAASLLALGEALHILGRGIYALGFFTALAGSIILLCARLALQKTGRREAALLLLSITIAFSFSMAVAAAIASGIAFDPGWLTVFSMPFMPFAYFYLIYRRQLGGMETRANRIVSTYAFLILLGLAFFIVITAVIRTQPAPETWAAITAALSLAFTLFTAAYLARFQKFIDRRVFGISLPYQNLPEIYASRIAACDDLPKLLAVLRDGVFPSLLVREYAFLQSQDKTLNLLLAKDTPDERFDFDRLTQQAGLCLPNPSSHEGWTRLILPLKVGDNTLGFWLLGKRDPDDHYPQSEIPILQSLADQTAIALSNIINSAQLRDFYRTDIKIIEDERNRIARDLHETVLNKLANMRNSLDQRTLPPGFLSAYEDLKKRLREIIRDLRPPMLDQGLVFAINDLIEDLREKYPEINIILNIPAGEGRLPEKVEEYLYHIVHEACENALKHSNCRTLTISGSIAPRQADLSIQDDGDGFDVQAKFNAAITNRHFGLAHMKERAEIIGARLQIRSHPGQGTVIHLSWKNDRA